MRPTAHCLYYLYCPPCWGLRVWASLFDVPRVPCPGLFLPFKGDMHISEENRWEIVSTWKTCKNITATACAHKVSRLAVRRWVQRYNATHAVTARRKPGRKHALSPEATKRALHLLLNEQSHGADGVAVQLLQEGLTSAKVHKCTVIRAAKKMARQNGADIQAVRGKPRKRLTLDTKSKRLQFCSANLRRS